MSPATATCHSSGSRHSRPFAPIPLPLECLHLRGRMLAVVKAASVLQRASGGPAVWHRACGRPFSSHVGRAEAGHQREWEASRTPDAASRPALGRRFTASLRPLF
jgi:hypothetical protein